MTRIGIDARLLRSFGMGTYVRHLLRALDELEGEEKYVVFATAEDRELVPPRFEVVEADVRLYTIREVVDMTRLIARGRLDLLHVPQLIVPITSVPVVATLFDAIPFHYALPNPRGTLYVALMMQWAAMRAERVLTISEAAKADLLEAFDCRSDKIVVTYPGVDDRFFHVAERVMPFRYFIFSGRVAKHKNMPALLEAFELVRRRDPGLRLVLAGARHERYAGLPGVIVPGFVSDEELASLYNGAIALVMPSFMEGFGLPPLEAMAAGTAVITSTARALTEVTGAAALHVDPRSPSDLAEAMWRLACDTELRDGLVKRGRAHARTFSWRRCAEQTRDVYREVLASQRA